jgi:sulfur relay (sulfurtransferase) DsrF/TusC family protein
LSDLSHNSNSKDWLITLSGKAHSSTALQAGADLALAAGAFGQRVTLVFSGEGLALLASEPDRHESLHRLLGSLPYYEIDRVYALASHNEATSYRDDLAVLPMSQSEWSAAEAAADIVVNY